MLHATLLKLTSAQLW